MPRRFIFRPRGCNYLVAEITQLAHAWAWALGIVCASESARCMDGWLRHNGVVCVCVCLWRGVALQVPRRRRRRHRRRVFFPVSLGWAATGGVLFMYSVSRGVSLVVHLSSGKFAPDNEPKTERTVRGFYCCRISVTRGYVLWWLLFDIIILSGLMKLVGDFFFWLANP